MGLLSVTLAIALFAALCGTLSLVVTLAVVGRLIGWEKTEYKVLPMQVGAQTSGLEDIEKQMKNLQDGIRGDFHSLNVDPDDVV